MASKLEQLRSALDAVLPAGSARILRERNELTIEVPASALTAVMLLLRDENSLAFEQCLDVCGMDYSAYQDSWQGKRFAAVYHLISVKHNWRLRVRCFAEDDGFPVLDSQINTWPSVDWYEREAFDLYGIVFEGHPDLRRILTDYGFVGHPFRKDFPMVGTVEMKYDPEQKRVVYQPVSIEMREVTPRIVREENYGG